MVIRSANLITLYSSNISPQVRSLLIVYVDDIILTENVSNEITWLKQLLASKFEIKDLGHLRYFLGMEVARSRKGIFVTQQKCILDLLKENEMSGCRPVDTPMEQNHRLSEYLDQVPTNKARYQRLVGRLMSQFIHNPVRLRWKLCFVFCGIWSML